MTYGRKQRRGAYRRLLNGRIKCRWAKYLYCDHIRREQGRPPNIDAKECPLMDGNWLKTLNKWVLVGRDPHAIGLEPRTNGTPQPGVIDERMASKASIYQVFDFPEVVFDFIGKAGANLDSGRPTPGASLTKAMCTDLRKGRYVWREISWLGFSRKDADKHWKKKNGAPKNGAPPRLL